MNKFKLYLLALLVLVLSPAKADEGMWLLQLMQEQHSIDMMKKLREYMILRQRQAALER